jgi:hypothetical protein
MDPCPLGDDVGDEPSVVVGRERHRPTDRGVDVDPVRPDVAGEADVQQVLIDDREVNGGPRCDPRRILGTDPTRRDVVTSEGFRCREARWVRTDFPGERCVG